MKVSRQMAALEPMVLGPLREVEGEDWHRTLPGKWSLVQVVQHLAMGVDASGVVFEARAGKRGMKRRSTPGQAVARHLVLGLGRLARRREPPSVTVPEDRPDPEETVAQFRMGVARFQAMTETWPEERQVNVFVRHPYLGDLNLPEWVRFHFVHARHHTRQIRALLRWLAATRA